jgi:hypothetical protein
MGGSDAADTGAEADAGGVGEVGAVGVLSGAVAVVRLDVNDEYYAHVRSVRYEPSEPREFVLSDQEEAR